MAALFIILGRRLHRTHPRLFLPPIFQSFHQTLLTPFKIPSYSCRFSTHHSFSNQNPYDPINFSEYLVQTHEPRHVGLLELVQRVAQFPSDVEAMVTLDESGIDLTEDLVVSAIWALRDQWRLAFLVFKWSEKGGFVDGKAWDLMIWILGNHKKFNMAWCLIRDLHQSSLDTRRAMLIMIERYAAVNDPCKAIETFYTMEKFRMTPDEGAFRTLLNALCKYGNIEEAEEFMLANKKLFPLETEAFNIILNGWCNIFIDVLEAKRVWRKMSEFCITLDAISYTHMISCFSKTGNLFDSLRLFDGMKKRGWIPSHQVYNSLIYVLTRENCFNEALKLLDKMKETGLQPDSATYNSMIRPLCEAKKLQEARSILGTMIEENIRPTIETYHAFLEGASFEGTLEVLNRIRKAGLGPYGNTFLLILAKFFKLEQPDNALKIWAEMKDYEVNPDCTHYTTLVQGLATCGCLPKAKEFYAEMISNGFLDDPKLKKLLNEPGQSRNAKKKFQKRQIDRGKRVHVRRSSSTRLKNHLHRSRKEKTSRKESKWNLWETNKSG